MKKKNTTNNFRIFSDLLVLSINTKFYFYPLRSEMSNYFNVQNIKIITKLLSIENDTHYGINANNSIHETYYECMQYSNNKSFTSVYLAHEEIEVDTSCNKI